MKTIKSLMYSSLARILALTLAAVCLSGRIANAHPYASNITPTNSSGFVGFTLNEDGGTVTVVYEDGSTNTVPGAPLDGSAPLAKGPYSFYLEPPHTSFKIICRKQGNGIPSLISSDTFSNSVWNSPRGVAVNKNPAIGTNFGRLVVTHSTPGGSGLNAKVRGLYLLNADQTLVKAGVAGSFYGPDGSSSSPYKVRSQRDGTFLVTDFSTANACLIQYAPDLSSSNLVLDIIGENQGIAAGLHGDMFGAGVMVGSTNAGNLVLYTFDSGLGTPSDTNCIKGPLTGNGSFNCVFRYNIGSGPLPWTKRPDYAYTYGLDGIAELRTEGDIGTNGWLYCGFGRANSSNPNLQILRPPKTTNGVTGDIFNKGVQDAARDATNWLYTSGVNPPFNVPPTGTDPWAGVNGSGASGGTFAGVRISPDNVYIASVDANNGATIATLTNGIPNDGTIFGIVNAPGTATSRGMDWDAADNLWITSGNAGQGLLRCYSLGQTTTCTSSNDWTGTNGTFNFAVPALQASVAVINGTASQNYTNNLVNPGPGKPGVFRISLNTSDTTTAGPTFVGFARGGSGGLPVGIVGGVNLTAGGSGYTSAPTVSFTAAGSSYGATAVATVSGGAVTAVTVTHPGAGYTAVPTISFSGGGGSAAAATAVMGLGFGQYILNTNEAPNGVQIFPNGVLFPAGVNPASPANWSVDVKVTPTQYPISGPTYTFNVRLLSGTNYSAAVPLSGNITILNTGPQFLQLAAAVPATINGMSRGISHDQARFLLTRWGDTNGPNNDAVNQPPTGRTLTITTINYNAPAAGAAFKATLGVDYTAGAQKFTGAAPVDGSPGITIAPGEVTVTAMIGNPVKHVNTAITATNLSVFINLTNNCNPTTSPGCNTNLLDQTGYPYQITLGGLTLNEFDNALGGEIVLWSNPLTNALDSTNWTLVYANINQTLTNGPFAGSPTWPTVISNYNNTLTNTPGPGAGPAYAWFGKPVHDPDNDFGALGPIDVPQSAAMAANGWSNALKLTVNKDPINGSEAGLNLYPGAPGAFTNFAGNYALRFDMYLSLYDFGLNNGAIGTPAREFAAFGINHYGTNCNWRLDVNPRLDGAGARPINADGMWCCIDAGSGSITPADYDMFISPAFAYTNALVAVTNIAAANSFTNTFAYVGVVPYTTITVTNFPLINAYKDPAGNYLGITNYFANNGVPNDQQSSGNNSVGGGPPAVPNAPQAGIIKNPPFSGINSFGGAPDNAWVDVSLEMRRQTNFALKVAQQTLFTSSTTNPAFGTLNQIAPNSGTPMLGYLDPDADQSDGSAFVYYSNMRIVELSPFIPWTNQPVVGLIVTQGSTLTLTSGAMYGTSPMTNFWYRGTTNGPNILGAADNGTPAATGGLVISNIPFASTSAITNLTVANIQGGTNYMSVWADAAGSVTSFVSRIEVVSGPGDKTVNAGVTTNLVVTAGGNAPPTSFQWMRGGTNIVAGTGTRFQVINVFGNPSTSTLWITNVTVADAAVYSNTVVGALIGPGTAAASVSAGTVYPAGNLSILNPPTSAAVVPSATNRPWGSGVTLTVAVTPANADTPLTYQWKKGALNLTDGGDISGASSTALTIANLKQSVYGGPGNLYTVGVTNSAGGVLSSSGNLTVSLLPHSVTGISVTPSNVVISFVSSNSFDTTNAFTLQSAGIVDGPYTNAPGTVTTTGGGFKVTAPYTGAATLFYRLNHSN